MIVCMVILWTLPTYRDPQPCRFKGSFLWEVEAPVMAAVCKYANPNPFFVALDFQLKCGAPVQEFFMQIQNKCDDLRRHMVDGNGTHFAPVKLAHACACKGCPQPAGLSGELLTMWSDASAAMAALK